MSLKGSATIELTNEDGSKEIIKHDNMITNAANDLMKTKRGNMATIFNVMSNGESYATALFGGILLFGEELEESADKYFLPTTNIIGYASQEAYSGLDVARGSFNQSESGWQEDRSYKFVWDFATSQANGTIKSLSLCPNIMGRIGASDTAVASERVDINNYMRRGVAPFNQNNYISNGIDGVSQYRIVPVALIGDILYAADLYNYTYNTSSSSTFFINNGKILKLYRFKIGQESISIKDVCCMSTYIDCIDITLPDDFVSTLKTSESPITFWFNNDTKSLIVFPCYKNSDVASKGTIRYIEIALTDNMKITNYTFTNNTNGIIKATGNAVGYSDENRNTFFVFNDYIVWYAISDNVNKMYVAKRSDNTDVKEVKFSNGEYKIETSSACFFNPIVCKRNILVFRRNHGNSSNPNWFYYILDMETGIIKITNAKDMAGRQSIDIGDESVVAPVGNYSTYYNAMNPFVVTTKNNLDTPVTKTASQTMKITYTLTESEGS